MRFEGLMAVKMFMLVLWVVTPCGLVCRYQRFRVTYFLHLYGESAYVFLKFWYLPASTHGVITTQNTNFDFN